MSDAAAAKAKANANARAIDLAAVLERVMGDRDLLQRVLARFALDYRDTSARLRAALAAHDAALAQRIAHTLKGASGMIDAGMLRQRALDLELALKAGGGKQATEHRDARADVRIDALVDALAAELARALREVDTMLAAPPAAPAPAPLAAPVPEHELARLRAMLDTGDGRAPDLVRQWRPGLLAALGHERMRTLDAAIARFDFERALALLEHREESTPGS